MRLGLSGGGREKKLLQPFGKLDFGQYVDCKRNFLATPLTGSEGETIFRLRSSLYIGISRLLVTRLQSAVERRLLRDRIA